MAETKYSKNVEGYSGDVNNYKAPDELMVVITLNEYRELVTFKGKHEHELSELKSEKWKLQRERDELKKKLTELLLKNEENEED